MSDTAPSPLLAALRTMSVPEQHRLALMAGTSRNYLYQLAGCTRRPGISLATGIVDAMAVMHRETNGRVPLISMQELASMCPAR